MKKWILDRWDLWIYCKANHSLKRMCERNGEVVYLMELQIKHYLELYPISENLKRATEEFYYSLIEMKEGG